MRTLLTRGGTLLAALTLVVAGAAPVAASSRTYSSIAAGDSHSCALTARGAAYCWGQNDFGQLGDGTTDDTDRNPPQQVIGGLKFASITGGEYHTCAITTRGAAYCWGYNSHGQLGDGTTTNSYNDGPQAVIGGLKFTSITAGEYHTCAITTRGAAYCWGYNDYGRLGDGTTDDTDGNPPQQVIGGLRFASISASYLHTCAITTRGAAYCWGYNGDGELGDGTTTASNEGGPQAVIGGLKFASIKAGEYHTCAITTRGAAYCWGYNDYGELGDGTTTDSEENGPQAVIGGLKFASIDGGNEHTCALTTRGTAYCWGANWSGQLGDGTLDDSEENGPQAVQ